jgi:hypothetical protein
MLNILVDGQAHHKNYCEVTTDLRLGQILCPVQGPVAGSCEQNKLSVL